MIWLTWRQFRAQTIATAALLAALGVVLLVSGLSLAHLYSESGLATCHPRSACQGLAGNFLSQVQGSAQGLVSKIGMYLVYLAPAIIGMFWGAPLIAREVETGTFRLAWNQSVSRSRWLLVKLGLIGLAAVATAGLLSLMTAWWSSPIFRAALLARPGAGGVDRLDPANFGANGIVPLGYAAFAFALGVTAGILIRRTIPAMAVTLAGFAFVQIAWPVWVRPHLITPLRESLPFNTGAINEIQITQQHQMFVAAGVSKPGAWILSNQSVKPDGRPFTGPATNACLHDGFQACTASLARLHLRQIVTFQPASRFWEFQWYETAIFAAAALALAGFCAWRIRRRGLH